MASAPIIPFNAPIYSQPNKPAVRIAFVAGEAQQAVSAATAQLPTSVHAATLDDLNGDAAALEIRNLTTAFIEQARTLLSPTMFAAFLTWSAAATHLATAYEEDEEGERRYAAAANARDAIHAVRSGTAHDFTFKAHQIELARHRSRCEIGPIREEGTYLYSGDPAPLTEALEALATRAFELSGNPLTLSEAVGGAMRQAFMDADPVSPFSSLRAILIERNAITKSLNDLDPANWQDDVASEACGQINRMENAIIATAARSADDAVVKLINVAQISAEGHEIGEEQAADAVEAAYRHLGLGFVFTGVPQANDALGGHVAPLDASALAPEWEMHLQSFLRAREDRQQYERDSLPAGRAEIDDPVTLAFDDLVSAEGVALARLLTTPAPGVTELITKLDLLAGGEQWHFSDTANVPEQLAADARRISFTTQAAPQAGAITPALTELRRAWANRNAQMDSTDEEDQAFYAELDRHEEVLVTTPAATVGEVLGKLQVAFLHVTGESWSDLALIDPDGEVFKEGLARGDMFNRMLWSGIKDLSKIAGVSLTGANA